METLLKSDAAMDVLATISLAQFVVIVGILIAVAVCVYKFKDEIKEFLEDYRAKANRKEEIMNKIRRVFTIVLSLIMIFAICSCGSGSNNNNNNEPSGPGSDPASCATQ